MMDRFQATGNRVRKRKAETQDNERLSKRLSLLNLGLRFPIPTNITKCFATQAYTPTRAQWREALRASGTSHHESKVSLTRHHHTS